MAMNQLAINQGTIMQCDTGRFIEVCSKAGFEAVELRIPKIKEYLYYHSAKEIKKILDNYSVKVLSLNALDGFAMIPEENMEIIDHETALVGVLCEMVECSLVVAPVSRWEDKEPSQDKIKNITASRLQRISEVLKRYGVKLGLEPIGFPEFTVRNLKFSEEILKSTQIDSIGLIPDVYNLFTSEPGPGVLNDLTFPIHLMHVNDAANIPIEKLDVMEHRVLLGEGQAKPEEWIRTAIKSGYTGAFSLELFLKEIWEMDELKAAKICFQNMKNFIGTI